MYFMDFLCNANGNCYSCGLESEFCNFESEVESVAFMMIVRHFSNF